MAKIRLYVDEDAVKAALIRALRSNGVEVVTVFDVDRSGCSDADQLAYAAQQGYVLFTYNAGDFFRLHTEYLRQEMNHAGIIIDQQQRYSVGEQLRRLLILTSRRSSQEMANRVEFLVHWS
ncbi:MAG: DUF5615 family PIN-like protein [Caldilineaceae bacterium]|nr:DUF5615 family PIN-like protein [Caldilineaceae bacterium]